MAKLHYLQFLRSMIFFKFVNTQRVKNYLKRNNINFVSNEKLKLIHSL